MSHDEQVKEGVVVDEDVPDVGTTLPAEMQSIVAKRAGFDPETAMAEFKYRADIVKMLRPLALAELRPTDFVMHGQTAYLQETGCQRVEGLLGIIYPENAPPKQTRVTLPNNQFGFTYQGYIGSKTLCQVSYVVGGRSSDEKFFDKFEDGKDGEKRRLPVPELLVQKAAFANFKVRAIAGFLGLRGLTKQDLKEMGFDHADRIKGFTYQSGGKGGGGGSNIVPNFGPEHLRGKTWDHPEVTMKDLKFYYDAIKQSVDNPKKSKWKASNEAKLEAIKAEGNRRRQEVSDDKGEQ